MRVSETGARVLVIGLDGADPSVVRGWTREGKLPHLAALAERGVLGELLSTPNAMSPAAWSSFVTGLGPGNHGIFYFMDRVPGTYETRYVSAASRDGTPMWTALSEAGKRVAGLFVPLTYPAVPVNGVLASGWLAPSLDDPRYAYPADLPRRMMAAAPEFELHTGMTEFVRRGRYAEALERKERSLRAKTKIAADLLSGERWDLFTVVFDETDPVQHYFWHFADPSHPDYSPDGARAFGDALLRIYQAADEAVGRLVALTGEDTHVCVISDHGSAPNTRGHLYLKDLLRVHGLEISSNRQGLSSRVARAGHDLASRLLPSRAKHWLAGRFGGLHEQLLRSSFAGDIDWAATKAYTFWSNGCCEPWINVRGRDPQGVVEPGSDYEAVVARVTEVILEAVDTRTGEPAAEDVLHRDALYSGPHLDRAPDLQVQWRRELVVQGLRVPGTGQTVEDPAAEDLRTGNHRREGLLVAAGPGMVTATAPGDLGIADLAPTIYALLDVPPPHHLDGRPWLELFPSARGSTAVTETAVVVGAGEGLSDADAAVVQQRLEDLGYL